MQTHFEMAVQVIHERIHLDQQRVNEALAEALRLIDENLFDPSFKASSLKLTLGDRALFSQVFDATPSLYIRVRRIEVALFLLDYTEGKIPAIGKLVGYITPASFNYTFKKLMGCSPKEERQNWRSENPVRPTLISEARFGGRPRSHRIHSAPIDRLTLVGAVEPHSAAFQLCQFRYLSSEDVDEVSWLGEWMTGYLEKVEGDARAIPEVPNLLSKTENLSPTRELELLQRATQPTLSVLDSYETSLPANLRSMTEHLRGNMTNPEFRLEQLRDEIGAHHADRSEFSRFMGVTPHQYLFEGRMETTSRLLRDSPLAVSVICQLMGYADPPQFRRAFKNWSGELSPDQYRRRARHVAARVGPAPPRFIHWRFLEQIRGESREEAMEMVRYLERVYGFADNDPLLMSPRTTTSDSTPLSLALAECLPRRVAPEKSFFPAGL